MIEKFKSYCKLAFRNRKILTPGAFCGCYYCCKTFQVEKIVNWTDKGETALCPFCGIDSVVVSSFTDYDEFMKSIKEANKEFF